MIRTGYRTIGTLPEGCTALQELKRYASVCDDSQDAMLAGLLKRAMVAVQEYADTSMLDCTMYVEVSGNEGNDVRLYQSVDAVTSVRDGRGSDLLYTLFGNRIFLQAPVPDVVVEYSTRAEPADVERLMPVAIRYATALYDGVTGMELKQILQEVGVC